MNCTALDKGLLGFYNKEPQEHHKSPEISLIFERERDSCDSCDWELPGLPYATIATTLFGFRLPKRQRRRSSASDRSSQSSSQEQRRAARSRPGLALFRFSRKRYNKKWVLPRLLFASLFSCTIFLFRNMFLKIFLKNVVYKIF